MSSEAKKDIHTKQLELVKIGEKKASLLGKTDWTFYSKKEQKEILSWNLPKIEFRRNLIFFKDEQSKVEFLEKGGIDKDSELGFNHSVMGEILGFPPSACKKFGRMARNKRICIDYHNIIFVSHIDDVIDDLKWMKKTYNIPKEKQERIIISVITDKFRDAYVFKDDEEIKLTKKDLKNMQKKHRKLSKAK